MPARNSFTWPLSAFACSASWLAAASMVLAESPDSAAAAVTSVMLAETSLVLAAASWTLREISSVAEDCQSTEAVIDRTRGLEGNRVSVRVDCGGRRQYKTKKNKIE